jgi:hypothetical protein
VQTTLQVVGVSDPEPATTAEGSDGR